MMKRMVAAFRVSGLATCRILARHPPARDLNRLRRIFDVVDDENVADETLHLGRDVGVVLVKVEAVDPSGMGSHERDQPGIGPVLDVVDAKSSVRIALAIACPGLNFGIHEHEIAHHAHLMRVRPRMGCFQLAERPRLPRIGYVEDRGAVRPMLMPDKRVVTLDHNLAPAGDFHPAEVMDVIRRID